ncbi:6-bladed beta-propeller [Viscerimonas tarda]
MRTKVIAIPELLFFLLLAICSCTQEKGNSSNMQYVYTKPSLEVQKNSNIIDLNVTDTISNDLYDSIDSINIIRLESTNESIIGVINKVYIAQDKIFVIDYFKSKAIFAFDLNGNFLYKIDKTGQGPGEYISINMAHIVNNTINILDYMSWKLISYDLTGNLLYEKRLNKPRPLDFIVDGGMIFCGFNAYNENSTPFRVVIVDTLLAQKETMLPFTNTREDAVNLMSRFQKAVNGDILYYYPPCDTIFQIEKDKIIPKYHFSLNDSELITSFYDKTKELSDNDFRNMHANSGINFSYSFFDLKDYLYVSYYRGDFRYTSLVSKNGYKCRNYATTDMKNKITYIPFVISGYHQNTLLGYIDESFFTLSAENMEMFYTHLKDEDIQKIKELEDTDNNPVVCLLYVKKS